MDTRPLHLAFLGCGWAARTHSEILAALPGIHLAYASRDPGRSATYRQLYRGDVAYESYEDALADPDLDGVVITTPPDWHLDLTVRALAAGKHVVVEKPAWPRAADTQTVRAAALHAGRQVLVAENYAYKPLLVRLRALLSDGAVGEPRFVQINVLRRQRTPGWRERGGVGALFEGGIHWINLLANLGFTVARVRGVQPGTRGRTDRSMLVVVEYAEGPVATLHYSWEIPTLFRGLGLSRIAGTAGVITFETNGLVVIARGRRSGVWAPTITDVSGYHAMWRDFLVALRRDIPPRMTLDCAERDLQLMEAIYAHVD
jgi:predicted dehydrogenase